MSRSRRAWIGRSQLLGSASSMTRLVRVVAASVLLLGLAPTAALAGSVSSSSAELPTAQVKHKQAQVHRAGTPAAHAPALVLQLGTGYDRNGSRPVRALQRTLHRAGDAPGPIDGRYGPLTERAVRRFQAAHHLQIDGIAGPQTLAVLHSQALVLQLGTGYDRNGSRPVRALQRTLHRAGDAPGPIDGRYGPLTERAVRRFQAAHHLQIDGIAGPQTLAAVRMHAHSPHQTIRRSHAVRSAHQATRSPRVSRPRSRPRRAQHLPQQVPSLSVQTAGRSTRSPSGALLGLLTALVLTLALATMTRIASRRRHHKRYRAIRAPKGSAPGRKSHRAERPSGPLPSNNPARSNARPSGAPRNGAPHDAKPRNGDAHNGADKAAAADATHPALPERGDAEGEFKTAVQLQQQGDLTEARTAYRRAEQLGHATAASNLGVLLEHDGNRAGAEAAYRRASDRHDPNGAFRLAVLLRRRGELTKARSAYERADELGHPTAASHLGALLERDGDLAGAETAYRRASARRDPNGAFRLAVLLQRRGDLNKARAAYERVNQLDHGEVARQARAALRRMVNW